MTNIKVRSFELLDNVVNVQRLHAKLFEITVNAQPLVFFY